MPGTTASSEDYKWWKHGVIYQVYPRSFNDSNGDGIGDIPGMLEKLDYLAWLGIDGIWLSPINTSPMYDFGYDISDYRGIEPVFGTMDDFKVFIKEAHKKKIRIVMDLVLNHTSHLHPWFTESRSSRDNPKRDWYIWQDGRRGRPPNNWMAAFGGRAWEWDEKTEQYYLHSFVVEQPDLNWRNSEVKKAVFADITFWLDMGIDGFRLDVVNWFVKDDRFRSNPFHLGPSPRPYDLQKHVYDRNRPETHEILKDFRRLLDSYRDRMSVGEVYSPPPGDAELSAQYLGAGDDELHLSFDFSLLYAGYGKKHFLRILEKWYSLVPEKGWPCTVLNNHDQPRSISRWGNSGGRARVCAALLLTAWGTPFVYYGEEVGMKNGKIKKRDIVDPLGRRYWPLHKGRDPERTPMQWDDGDNAGFTSGVSWLPVNSDYKEVNVKVQTADPGSLLNLYRDLLALRKKYPALLKGDWAPVETGKDILAYTREYKGEKILVVLNLSSKKRSFKAAVTAGEVIFNNRADIAENNSDGSVMGPYEILIIKYEKSST